MNTLPPFAAAFNPSDSAPVWIKHGVMGYRLLDTGEHPDEYNRRLGVTPAQREAMIVGSMFGWDVPGADPSAWLDAPEAAQWAPADHKLALRQAIKRLEEAQRRAADTGEQMERERDALQAEIDQLKRERRDAEFARDIAVKARDAEKLAQAAAEKAALAQQRKVIEAGDDYGLF